MNTTVKNAELDAQVTVAPANQELIVEVVDDTPEQDRGKSRAEPLKEAPPGIIPSDDELQQYSEQVQKRFKRMSYEYHEQRRQREGAEREREVAAQLAQRLYQENQQLRGTVHRGEKTLVEQAKGRIDAQIESAKDKFRKAHTEGDTEALVKAQEEMASLQAQKQTAENYQPQFEEPKPQPQQQQRPQQQAPAIDPKAKEWAEQNTWFQTNKRMTAYAFGVHDELVSDKGIDPRKDPDKYYAELDKAMREQFPTYDGFEGEADRTVDFTPEPKPKPQVRQQAPSTVVAPASRISVSKDGRKVQLTASQAALAKRLGLTNEQYALEALKIARQDQ